MIERVAKAIFASEYTGPWDTLDEEGSIESKEIFRRMARAAIEAMREPTPDMGLAGYTAFDKFGEDAVLGPEELVATWQSMIDAALK